MDFANPREPRPELPEEESRLRNGTANHLPGPGEGQPDFRGSSPAGPRIQDSVTSGALNPYSEPLTARERTEASANAQLPEEHVLPVWMQRTMLVIYVLFCVEIGLVLAVLPWTRAWTENALISSFPLLKTVASYNFTRGVVTGLGLLDLWLGIWEAVHYRDHRPHAQRRAA